MKPTRASTRKSTVKNSQELKNYLQQREIKAQEKKSLKLSKLIEQESEAYCQEASELIDLADNIESAVSAAESETSLVLDSSISTETEVVDPLGVWSYSSPADRTRSVSTEINRFECGNESSLSPERIGQLNLNPLEENLSTIDEVFEVTSITMEENIYKEKLKQAKLHKRKFNSLLSTFTVDDITNSVHKDIYHQKINEISSKYLEISDWFDAFIIDLEENNENDRVVVIESLQNEIKYLKRNNETLLMNKIAELVSGQPEGPHSVDISPSVSTVC